MKKYKITNIAIADLLEFYCEGKSKIWKLFFGWRCTHWDTKGNFLYCEYIVPNKILVEAVKLSRKFENKA